MMVKDIWDTSISERRQIVRKYEKSKQLSEEIAKVEEKYGMWIGELADRFEEMLYERSHCWFLMTLAELRAWNKGKAFLTDEEKQLYAAQSGCSYDVFEELASERLMHLEIVSWRQKSRMREQENKELQSYLQELEKKGKAFTKDGKCYIVPSENTVFHV